MIKINALEIKDEKDVEILASALRSSMTYCLDACESCITYKDIDQLATNLGCLYRVERLYCDLTEESSDNSFRLSKLMKYAERENVIWPISVKDTYYWSQYGS